MNYIFILQIKLEEILFEKKEDLIDYLLVMIMDVKNQIKNIIILYNIILKINKKIFTYIY